MGKYILPVIFCLITQALSAQYKANNNAWRNPALVSDFYDLIDKRNFWFTDSQSIFLRKKFTQIIDSASNWALNKSDYHATELHKLADNAININDSAITWYGEQLFTDAAISFFKDLYEGSSNNIGYSDFLLPSNETEKKLILNKLVALCNGNCFEDVIASLEPTGKTYAVLKKAYQNFAKQDSTNKLLQIKRSLNYLRWINHFQFSRYVIVNIPATVLQYYVADTIALSMKIIVGKPSTQTPRFAAYCDEVILYPYWNVPASIVRNELFSLFKKSPNTLNTMNMQVIDEEGHIVNPANIHWSSYNKYNFPYRIRQSTGCDNALGVIKFNLTSPFNVYMHDTNTKSLFANQSRFYSHGCIRIEKPIELANLILPSPVDSSFLKACLKEEKPVELKLTSAVPVFVIYNTLDVDANNKIVMYKDVYNLIKNK